MNLKENVAKLVSELLVIAAVSGIGELVGLFDGVRNDRPLVLLAVPRALAPEAPSDLVEADERLGPMLGAPGGFAGLGAHPLEEFFLYPEQLETTYGARQVVFDSQSFLACALITLPAPF